MRHFDLSPLYRSTVGFDRVGSLIDAALSAEPSAPTYPPYNIEKVSDDAYRISVAVAGFTEDELNIEAKDGQLTISGAKNETDEKDAPSYLYRGIAARAFERRFQLADHVRATGAALQNGLLHIDLVREVPEALKPRKIEIAKGATINA